MNGAIDDNHKCLAGNLSGTKIKIIFSHWGSLEQKFKVYKWCKKRYQNTKEQKWQKNVHIYQTKCFYKRQEFSTGWCRFELFFFVCSAEKFQLIEIYIFLEKQICTEKIVLLKQVVRTYGFDFESFVAFCVCKTIVSVYLACLVCRAGYFAISVACANLYTRDKFRVNTQYVHFLHKTWQKFRYSIHNNGD